MIFNRFTSSRSILATSRLVGLSSAIRPQSNFIRSISSQPIRSACGPSIVAPHLKPSANIALNQRLARASIINTNSQIRGLQTSGSTSTNSSVADAHAHKSKLHGSYHWSFERILVFAFLPAYFYPLIVGPNPIADFILSIALPVHGHLGFANIIQDYLPVRKFSTLYYVAMGILYSITALTMYGLYSFNTNDIGLTQFVGNVWNAKKYSTEAKKSSQ